MKGKIKKTILLGISSTAIYSFVVTGCSNTDIINAAPDTLSQEELKIESIADNDDVEEVEIIENIVKSFGDNLKMVSLLAPEDILRESMEEYYGEFISNSLLEKWIEEPTKALGRLTSSPWPNGIDILNMEKVSENEYKVEGEVVEVTSQEVDKDEAFLKYNVTLTVRFIDNNWLIDDAVIGEANEESMDF